MSENPKDTKTQDAAIGALIRLRRTQLEMSQTALAKRLGLTFQQVQKYEKGTNRVGASRLQQIAEILAVPVTYFYDNNEIPDGSSVVELLRDPFIARAVLALGKLRVNNRPLLSQLTELVETITAEEQGH